MYRTDSLENVTFQEIAEAFNAAFSDYLVPIVYTAAQFRDKFANEGGRLDLSVGVFHEKRLVAFILNFFNESTGRMMNYNGGTGVVPDHRGKRLATRMYDFMLPKLKAFGVYRMVLEVAVENTSALKIYQHQGFQIQRELYCYKGELNGRLTERLPDEYGIVELADLDWQRLCSFWDHPPTWQNSVSTMNRLKQRKISIGVARDDGVVGYLIYDPEIKRIHQMAVEARHRNRGVGSTLLSSLLAQEKQVISFINLDSRISGISGFLAKHGLERVLDQYEMTMDLTSHSR